MEVSQEFKNRDQSLKGREDSFLAETEKYSDFMSGALWRQS
jgi:hypothetical protein